MLVDGAPADKPARQVDPAQDVKLLGPPPPFVSRAGAKLAGALDRFGIDPTGLRCLDAGSSTGGFTDCLLQRGAAAVVAVDVGTHQLHERLRRDARVDLREQTDIRSIDERQLGGRVDLTVGDLSFISLIKVLPGLIAVTAPGSSLLLLIKPQFEAGRIEVSRGKGIITDPAIWLRVLGEVAQAADRAGAPMVDLVTSSITGTNGNVEFVGRFVIGGAPVVDLADRIAAEVRRAGGSEPPDGSDVVPDPLETRPLTVEAPTSTQGDPS